ncbi:hypothetical protein AB0F92_41235 [Kitasatospora aureofaciens]|uniref:hypothetical protein n=1 Tax=Kitasatospora aureofaciens TaxID=1894 RepID=UPI0033C1DA6E
MPDATPLDHADAMIERAWGRPIAELEKAAPRLPVEDPMLRAAMHTRSRLVVVSNSAAVHQDRLHALTRSGQVPAFYDLDRITESASALRTAYAESNTALHAIRNVIDAREHALKAEDGPAAERARAATARTSQAPRPLGLPVGPARPAGRCRCGPARGEPPVAAGQFVTWSWWAPGSAAPTTRASSSRVISIR